MFIQMFLGNLKRDLGELWIPGSLFSQKKLAEYLGVQTIHPSSCITHSDHCLAKRFHRMFIEMFLTDV